ncbi:Os01g0111300, partial [Oryza sativa Japonica Group]
LSLPSAVARHSAPADVALRCLSSAPHDLALSKKVRFEISFGSGSFVKLVFTKG